MNKIMKHLSVGPGGLKCSCCAPPRGKRKEFFRSAKRKEKRIFMQDHLSTYDAWAKNKDGKPQTWEKYMERKDDNLHNQ